MITFLRIHFTKCCIAGIVALLPVVGVVLSIVYVETQVANSWLKDQGFYFFGMGLLITIVLLYLVGLAVSTFIGQFAWNLVDRLLDRLPILGNLYQTLKQILGYGEGPNAFFRRVVYIKSRDLDGEEIGLVTREALPDDELQKIAVFVPSAPSPTSGRMIVVENAKVRVSELTVNQAMKLLVSIGAGFGDENKLDLPSTSNQVAKDQPE